MRTRCRLMLLTNGRIYTLDARGMIADTLVVRIDGQATWVNSAALRVACIDSAARDPDGGVIARDVRGEPTGLLVDTAQRLLHAVEPRPTDEQFDRAVRECLADCLAVGLTG